MVEFSSPMFPRDWGDYDQFVASIQAIHQVAAPEVGPGFSDIKMRHANANGTYFYFPHPTDGQEVLRFAQELVVDADDVSRSLVVPKSIIAAHMFSEGNGRTSRRAHAALAGRSDAEIAALQIDGPRIWIGADEEARKVIDLRTPTALEGHIESYLYEVTGTAKRLDLNEGFVVTNEGVKAYNDLLTRLPKKYTEDLEETVLGIVPYNEQFIVQLLDAESVSFALNAQRLGEGVMSEERIDLVAALAEMGQDGIVRLVDDVWRYRLLRAKASIACLAQTALGSCIVALADHDEPKTLRRHFIQLSNNLVKDRF